MTNECSIVSVVVVFQLANLKTDVIGFVSLSKSII